MTHDGKDALREQIARAIKEGKVGRQQLIDRVATMPVDRIAALPPSAIAMLGASGLAAVADRRADMTGLRPKVEAIGKTATVSPSRSPSRASHPLVVPALAAMIILMGGLVADLLLPMALSRQDPGIRPIETSLWQPCPRLDVHMDGCVYTTGGSTLTLARAARLLRMPVAQIAAVNPTFASSPDELLPTGTRLVVWRGVLKLKGDR